MSRVVLTFLGLFFTIKSMGRPKKEKSLLMNVPLRIMLTAEQKSLIEEAAKLDQADMTAWSRPILIRAAHDRIVNSKPTGARRKQKDPAG